MRYALDDHTFRGSATDLANHARCEHLTQRSRELAVAIAEGRAERSAKTGQAIEKGAEFEAQYVARRRAEIEAAGGRFLDVQKAAAGDPRRGRELLEQAMRDGVELIAQAPMHAGTVFGFADLLERVADAAAPAGNLRTTHRYEPHEIKYARSVKPEHLLQASAYADALERLQGELPANIHVVVQRDGAGAAIAHPTSEYVEYFRAARERFAMALSLDLPAELERVPEPVAWCANCEFSATCDERRRAVDHLGFVAGIRADQRAKLAAVGIETLAALATTDLEKVPGIGRRTLPRLRRQAGLQLAARERARHDAPVAFRDPADEPEPAGRGFALLPAADAEDIFFDFEGYPYHESGALEYLWGWTSYEAPGTLRFDYLWVDTPDEEAAAFTRFLDEVHARRERSPGMHVYHYAPYEITALRRLAKQHPREQRRLDQLLRAGVFVDLFAVVRQALQVGTESYSIKALEPLYGVDRSGDELADGGSSIEVYEQWLLEGDPTIRQKILDYNEVDCVSTVRLRDWLLARRDEALQAGIEWPAHERPVPTDEPEANQLGDETPADPHPTTVLVERLEAVADDPARPDDVRLAARLLSAMPGWQRRVEREFWGDLHGRRHDRDIDDYVVEPAALGDLTLLEEYAPEGARPGTIERRYRFPGQVSLVEARMRAIDPIQVADVGCVQEVDHEERTVTIRTTGGDETKLDRRGQRAVARAIVGFKDIRVDSLQVAAARVAQQLLDALDADADPFDPTRPGAAPLSMLARHATRVGSGAGPEALDHAPDPTALADLVRRADGSHVIVQGPPGTGKTWTSARLIAELVASGMRVGISSNSHDAVINVLRGIDRYRRELELAGASLGVRAAYTLRSAEKQPGTLDFGDGWLQRGKPDQVEGMLQAGDVNVVAGTAWQFAREGVKLDAILVDEAGQVSLLHATAMASSAGRVVLVGDPQQLPQPTAVQHPFGCGASVLEHLFDGEAVLPPERAVLLPTSRRMHPDVCRFISTSYYAGELEAHPATATQRVAAAGLPATGTHLLRVDHAGNRTSAPEEVAVIRGIVEQLLADGRVVAKPDEDEREIVPEDIIVVAPYNAQRRALAAALPDGVAVGTVDRFQGKEAPVAILSLTASSRHELPRGLEFLLDPHRMNVAISRARALAIVVASPSLLATPATSLHEMRLLNDVARIAHASSSRAEALTDTAAPEPRPVRRL